VLAANVNARQKTQLALGALNAFDHQASQMRQQATAAIDITCPG
jgi:hypothetical protein